ncbi:MAG: 2-C-methyl-D-erythritol 4-phosphate cytidylyltransferase [Methylocystaceae bacterium]
MAKSVGVILAAAGQARRMGMGRNKAYLLLQGKPILAYSLQFFAAWPEVKQVVVVTGQDEIALAEELVKNVPAAVDKTQVVVGGRERQDSVFIGLAMIATDIDWVAVHDAARPLISSDLFLDLLAQDAPGVIPVIPVTDTVKQVDEQGMVVKTIPRSGLFMVQTPQVFQATVLRECYSRARAEGYYGTDDASLLEHYGYPVKVVAGMKQNLKITTPLDLDWSEVWLQKAERGV